MSDFPHSGISPAASGLFYEGMEQVMVGGAAMWALSQERLQLAALPTVGKSTLLDRWLKQAWVGDCRWVPC